VKIAGVTLPDGCTVTAGLVDLQVNGLGDAYPLEDPTQLEALDAMLASHGVTSYLVAAPSSDPVSVAALSAAVAEFRGGCLGLHLEGPVLNPDFRGAHALEHLRPASDLEARGLLELPGVRLITLAPELPGAMELARLAMDRGIVVAAGHTGATAEQAHVAIDAGITLCTHLFNAMTPVHQRAPGVGIAYVTDPRTHVAFIADGVHLHDDMVALILSVARDRAFIVSDAAPARGVSSAVLAGSMAALDAGVRRIAASHTFDLAIECASARPAAILDLPDRDDAVVWDEARDVIGAVRAGEFVFRNF